MAVERKQELDDQDKVQAAEDDDDMEVRLHAVMGL